MLATTDAAFARRRLEKALAMNTQPTLTSADVDDLMVIAATVEVIDGVEVTTYTSAGLNAAAEAGWQDKAGLTSDRYDLGGGPGRTLNESQWHVHCALMADRYKTGSWSVLGGSGQRSSGIGVVNLVTPAYTDGDA